MTGHAHDPEVRSQVMAALLAGQSANAVAKEYRLPVSTVKSWKRRVKDRGCSRTNPKNEPEPDFGIQLATYLKELLTTLQVQAECVRDRAWLAKQDASEVAVLHGVLCDKAIRILEAAEAANEPLGDDTSP